MRIVAGILIGGYLILLVVANFTPCQRWLADIVENALEDKLQTEVSIDRLELGLFNRVLLHDVRIKDRQKADLLKADMISAKIEYLPLLEGRVALRSVSLLDAEIGLYKDKPDSAPNYQFVLDAFKSKKEGPSKLNLSLNSLIIRRCRITYDEHFSYRKPEGFQAAHINVYDLNANISLKTLTPDSINLRVRAISLKERSGLDVQKLTFRLAANKRRCTISDFELRLPHSHLSEERLEATYDIETRGSFVKTLRLKGRINDAHLALKDVACFSPALHPHDYTLTLSTDYEIRPDKISLKKLDLQEVNGRLSMAGQTDILRSEGEAQSLHATLDGLQFKQGTLTEILQGRVSPEVQATLDRLGNISLSGNGILDRQGTNRFDGKITTEVGTLNGELLWRDSTYHARLASAGLSPDKLFARKDLPRDVAFNINMQAEMSGRTIEQASGTLHIDHATYRDYTYKQLSLQGDWKNQTIEARLTSDDPNLDFEAKLKSRLQGLKPTAVDMEADVRRVAPSALNFTGRLSQQIYSGRLRAAIPSLTASNAEGVLEVEDFVMQNAQQPDDVYHLNHLQLTMQPEGKRIHSHLESDFAYIDFKGSLSWPDLRNALASLGAKSLPTLIEKPQKSPTANDLWHLTAHLYDPAFFSKVLGLPLDFDEEIKLQAQINPSGERSTFTASAPQIRYGTKNLQNPSCYVKSEAGDITAVLTAIAPVKKTTTPVTLTARTHEGFIESELSWGDKDAQKYHGGLKTRSLLHLAPQGSIEVNTEILPTTLAINDSTWNIAPGAVLFANNRLTVKGVNLTHKDQSIAIDGYLSKSLTDSLTLDLNRIDVAYIMSLTNIKPVSFGGYASGRATLAAVEDGRFAVASRLDVADFKFNDAHLGQGDIGLGFTLWDQRLHFDAEIKEPGVSSTKVLGYVGIGEKLIDLNIESLNTPLGFMNRYVGGFLADISGRSTGRFRIHGTFRDIDFEGEQRPDLEARIRATGSRYRIHGGDLKVTAGRFELKDFLLTDNHGGNGTLSGNMTHSHTRDIHYNFNITADKLQLYNKGRGVDLPFYATAYGTGSGRIYGSPGKFAAQMKMKPEAGTLFTYVVDNRDGGYDAALLKFGQKSAGTAATERAQTEKQEKQGATPQEAQSSTLDVRLELDVDMNPNATLKVITDERSGNFISLYGTGNLLVEWHNKGAFQMIGKYDVDGGLYKMIIQDVVHKDLEIQDGGLVHFNGDPYEASLSLKAVHTVPAASLADLGLGFTDKSVRADCILGITGVVKQPQVNFSLSLPNASEEVNQMVKQLISSEEDMNMQMLYLLGVGRFYNYNFAATEAASGGQSQSSVAMKSFLSSTLSGQLNTLLRDAMGTSNWTFGANLSTGDIGWSDMEVGGLLTGRLFQGRLRFNGNFGYRERTYSNTNFVGDFNVTYALTPSGNFLFKAYSETNDRYFSKSSMTTQGIGLQFMHEFSSFRDLFRLRKRSKGKN